MKKFYLLLFGSFCFLCGSFAQSPINPVTGGNFDLGNTFASNGWTVVNSSANKWVVGSTTYRSDPNSAYISMTSTSSPGLNDYDYDYDNTTPHISHFYQQVTIPATAVNVVLSFYLKGDMEKINNSLVDGFEIYTDASLTVPVADALPGGTAVRQFFQLGPNPNYVHQTWGLNSLAGKTVFIIFTWKNDGNGMGSGPPVSIDDIGLTYCIKNTNYALTGGGGFCTGTPGAGVGLAGSVTGISYQLYRDGVAVGAPVDGNTGSPVDFGFQNVPGVYTVIGTSGACSYPMPGSVTVTENPLPVATVGSNPLNPCAGTTLNLTSGGGTSYAWTGPGGFTSTSQNPSIANVATAASGTYTVTVTDANTCSAAAGVDISVQPAAVGGSISGASGCSGNGSLTLSGNSGSVIRWEYTTDSTSAAWTPIVNTSNTQSFTGITVETFYRAVVGNPCGNVNSSIASVAPGNYWTGSIDDNWNTPGNWSGGVLPTTACPDVYIPNTPNKPVLSGAPTAAITNIHILAGAKVTVNGTGLMQIAGAIFNAGTFDVSCRGPGI